MKSKLYEYFDDEFVDYVYDFYGVGGIFGDHFNNKLTYELLVDALNVLVERHLDYLMSVDEVGRENIKGWLCAYHYRLVNEPCEYIIGKYIDENGKWCVDEKLDKYIKEQDRKISYRNRVEKLNKLNALSGVK